jgi:selenocysteine-specific elongation factor
LRDEEARARYAMVALFRHAGLTPPDLMAVATHIGVDKPLVERIAALLVRQKVLVRAGDLLFHEEAVTQLETEIRALKDAGIAALDVVAFKERYHLSRKYAIPLLELLDRERVTRRVGDTRYIL